MPRHAWYTWPTAARKPRLPLGPSTANPLHRMATPPPPTAPGVAKTTSKTVTDTIVGQLKVFVAGGRRKAERLMSAGEHTHTIVGYSLIKGIGDGEPIASERFTVGGHEWVRLWGRGTCRAATSCMQQLSYWDVASLSTFVVHLPYLLLASECLQRLLTLLRLQVLLFYPDGKRSSSSDIQAPPPAAPQQPPAAAAAPAEPAQAGVHPAPQAAALIAPVAAQAAVGVAAAAHGEAPGQQAPEPPAEAQQRQPAAGAVAIVPAAHAVVHHHHHHHQGPGAFAPPAPVQRPQRRDTTVRSISLTVACTVADTFCTWPERLRCPLCGAHRRRPQPTGAVFVGAAAASGGPEWCSGADPVVLPQGVVNTSDGKVVRAFHRFTLVDQSGAVRWHSASTATRLTRFCAAAEEARHLTKGRMREAGAVKISCARQVPDSCCPSSPLLHYSRPL
jgi:hypothetical protein